MILILIFAFLLTFSYLRMLRQRSISLESKYALYSLRDELRELAIDGKVDPRNWVFNYLDSSISVSIDRMNNISLWSLFAVAITHKQTKSEIARKKNLELGLSRSPELKRVYDQFGVILVVTTLEKHKYSILTLLMPISGTITALGYIKQRIEKTILNLRIIPDGSDANWAR